MVGCSLGDSDEAAGDVFVKLRISVGVESGPNVCLMTGFDPTTANPSHAHSFTSPRVRWTWGAWD